MSDNPHPHGSVSPVLNVVGDEKAADAEKSAEAGTEEETRGEKEEMEQQGFPAMGSEEGGPPVGEDKEDKELRCEPREPREAEGRSPGKTAEVYQPTQAEWSEHFRCGHIPFRSWCPHCNKGRARATPHKGGSAAKVVREHPRLAIDYGYLKDQPATEVEIHGIRAKGGGTIIAGMEAKYGLLLCMLIPEKGTQEPWVARRIAAWLDRLGSVKVTVQGDGEGAMTSLIDQIRRERKEGAITLSDPPERGDSQGNHYAEGAVNIAKGLIRT